MKRSENPGRSCDVPQRNPRPKSSTTHRIASPRDVPLRGTSRQLDAFDFRAPLSGGEGRTIRPRRGNRQGCRFLFARAGCPVEKPGRPSRTGRPHRPAPDGGAVSFGYFSLGKQRKVTRPPAGGRKPAAGEPDRDIATIEDLRRDDEPKAKVSL